MFIVLHNKVELLFLGTCKLQHLIFFISCLFCFIIFSKRERLNENNSNSISMYIYFLSSIVHFCGEQHDAVLQIFFPFQERETHIKYSVLWTPIKRMMTSVCKNRVSRVPGSGKLFQLFSLSNLIKYSASRKLIPTFLFTGLVRFWCHNSKCAQLCEHQLQLNSF